LDNNEAIIDGVRFLGSTLWTDFKLFGELKRFECLTEARWLNDFRLINTGNGDVFSPRDSADLFEQSVEWLTRSLDKPFEGKTVVISHHLPSFVSVAERYKNDLLSACFSSNLDHLFGKMDLWIHGHTHDSCDYVKNGTRVVCNPRGYCRYPGTQENLQFNPKLVVEI
jgi:calcineurin-like phosphoesterase family protein